MRPGPLSWLREFFSLRQAEQRTLQWSLVERIAIRVEVNRAIALMCDANEVRHGSVRTQLVKQALETLLVAVAAVEHKRENPSASEWPDRETAFRLLHEHPSCRRQLETLTLLWSAESPIMDDRQIARLEDLFATLERHVDTRTARDFLLARILRATAVIALLGCCCWYLFSPANLARGRTVTASSRCPHGPPDDLAAPPLHRVVDGVYRESVLALCTEPEPNPWVTIDLGMAHTLHQINVYSRANFESFDREGPVALQVSKDNVHFETVGTTDKFFTIDLPWKLTLPNHRKARYVRLFGTSGAPQKIYVSEIEVIGR